MANDKLQITTQSGETVEASAPIIISASRSTDIPAYYAKWFFNRLKAGYCVWYNPFNRKPMYISFAKTKVVVFWTKNPAPIIPYLHELDKRRIHYYFQFTLNDYEKERFEPNVPPLEKRIETFKLLSEMIGKERVIWRFDPLIVAPNLSPRDLLKKIWFLGNRIKGYTDKLVFSFIDVKAYKKVQNNLIKETGMFTRENVETAEMNDAQRNELVEGLVKIREAWKAEGWNIELATCAESVDLDKYNIAHNRCIDGELMEKLWNEDKELVYYLRTGKVFEPSNGQQSNGQQLFEQEPPTIPTEQKNMKDKGQRLVCGCMVSKDIGMYDTCSHFCVYCYANTSRETVLRNQSKHKEDSESIIE